MKHTNTLVLLLLPILLTGCAPNGYHDNRFATTKIAPDARHARKAIDNVLDDFHDAAANADYERYFSHFAPTGYFLGTDATERWDLPTFQSYTRQRFDTGVGWTYTPRSREVVIDLERKVAWFDELLDSQNYSTSRGTGVLTLDKQGNWRIEQYHLSFPIPNDIARDLTQRIKEYEASHK